jgi:hypothetical protein
MRVTDREDGSRPASVASASEPNQQPSEFEERGKE